MKSQQGTLTIEVIIFGAVAIIVGGGFMLWSITFLNFSLRNLYKVSAFTIAEAGVEYYRWHLAHAPTDYQDGTGGSGPYIHNYYDKDGNVIGQFTLDITPPPSGSTVVTIKSTGQVGGDPSLQKTIQVKMGIPSFAKYAFASNSDMRFGAGTEVFGEIISNGGIRFDGVAHNIVYSAVDTYTDPDSPNDYAFGVHTHTSPADPSPPAAMPSRPDVFNAGRQVGVPAIDFDGLIQDLANIKSAATSGGVYFPTSTTGLGYDLVFNSDHTYAAYVVTALVPAPSGCTNYLSQSGWGTWSIQTETLYASGTIPTSGIFFVEDNLWVRGTINGDRITVGSGKFPDNPATRTSITINQDLLYTNYDSTDVIQLIAQNNINVGLVSNNIIRIDAALIAQNGRAGRYYYRSSGGGSQRCSPYDVRSTLTSFGMIGTNLRYGFAYTNGTGYSIRNLVYDSNLLYSPPPLAPQTNDQYSRISWDELK